MPVKKFQFSPCTEIFLILSIYFDIINISFDYLFLLNLEVYLQNFLTRTSQCSLDPTQLKFNFIFYKINMSDINIYTPFSLEFFFFKKTTCNNTVKVYTDT